MPQSGERTCVSSEAVVADAAGHFVGGAIYHGLMRGAADIERTRAALAFACFIGLLAALVAGAVLFPALGVPAAFFAMGAIASAPVFFLLRRSIGAPRASLLALLVAAGGTATFALTAFGVYAAGG